MKNLVERFPEQLQEALSIGQSYHFQTAKKDLSEVVLTGLGGSGIGGSIVQNYVSDNISIPFLVNKDYTLPGFVGSKTLVIVSSYSGNTEETVLALEEALRRQATIICITSGGKISEIAKEKGLDCILLPDGMPPRACLGYSLVQVLFTLHHFEVISGAFVQEIGEAKGLLIRESQDIQIQAKEIAQKLLRKTPIIYAASNFEGVAVRFRQQINENSKMLAWHHVIPEMNHNELVGWRDKDENRQVIFLRNHSDYYRIQTRIEINKKIIAPYSDISEIWSKGASYFEKAFYLIHFTDWVSVFLAEMHGVDAVEVQVIDYLKGELAKT